MATVQNIKDALTFPADPTTAFIKNGRTIGTAEVTRIQAWFEGTYADELKDAQGDPRSATANDFAAFLWRQIAGAVKQYERRVAEAALSAPDELDEV